MTSILDIGELLDQIAKMIQEVFGYDPVEFGLIDGDEVAVRISTRQPGDIVRLKVGQEGITGWVASTGELLLASDVSKDPHYIRLGNSKTRSELAVPILSLVSWSSSRPKSGRG